MDITEKISLILDALPFDKWANRHSKPMRDGYMNVQQAADKIGMTRSGANKSMKTAMPKIYDYAKKLDMESPVEIVLAITNWLSKDESSAFDEVAKAVYRALNPAQKKEFKDDVRKKFPGERFALKFVDDEEENDE